MSLDIDFDLEIELGKQAKSLDSIRKQLQLLTFKSVPNNLTASGVTNAAGFLSLKVGQRPLEGRVWKLLRVCIFGTDDQTVLVGSKAAIYIGPYAQPNLSDLIIPASTQTVPFVQLITKDAAFVTSKDDVYVNVYGGGNGQVINANITVVDENTAAREWDTV